MAEKLTEILTAKNVLEAETFSLFSLEPTDTVLKTLQTLNEKNISGAPLLENQQIIGCIDVVDILAFASSKLSMGPDTNSKNISEFAKESVKNVLNSSQRSTWTSVPGSTKLSEIIRILSQADAHRVAIVNSENQCQGLITQSQLVRFFFKNAEKFQSIMNKKVSEIVSGKESRKVLTVFGTDFVLEAFQKMRENHIGGLPIVDENFVLIGQINASDIRRAQVSDLTEMRDDLYSQLKVFLNFESSSTKSGSVPSAKLDDTLGFIIAQFAQRSLHRVYVIDDQTKPINVISLRDIIEQFQ